MANLRDIRNRIESIQNTQQITRAMKMVAAAKLRKAQNRIEQTRPYAFKMQEVVGRLVQNASGSSVLLREPESIDRVLLIVVGSDRGLCGAFNNNLFKVVESHIKKEYQAYRKQNSLSMLTIGKKPSEYFERHDYDLYDSFRDFFDDLKYARATNIMEDVVGKFVTGKFDKVVLAYNEFKSVLTQNRRMESLLPIDPQSLQQEEEAVTESIDYIYEPGADSILKSILPKHLNMQLWRALLESNAAEQGARMTSMDNATENADELQQELQLKYNQARQEAITTEISEIVSGAQALREA